MNNFSRAMSALVLTASLLASSVAAVGQQTSTTKSTDQAQKTSQTQTDKSTDTKSTEAKPTDTQETDNGKATEAKTEQPKAQPVVAKSTKPLSTDENPDMIGKRNINHGIIAKMSGSTEKEVRQGREAAAEVDRQAKFIDDPVITEYVNRVGQNIVLHSDAKVPFTIKVIDSDEVNAFALPGGFFYVNKGLILAADNEAEMAGVMAHEIGHVAARHAMENQTKGMLANIGLLAGSIFLGGLGGLAIKDVAQFGALLGFMKFSRNAESEADMLGVEYLWAAGYDPNAMSTMFEKLAAQNKKKPGTFSKLFETHPQSVDRMEATRALIARFPEREEYVESTSEFQRVKARLLRLSNAKASTAGDISPDSGASGRPTLKRRSPTPDDTTTGEDQSKPTEKKDDRPTLKRKTDDPQQNPPE